jgi:hypothetical protein
MFSRYSLDAAWPTLQTGRTLLASVYVKAGTATHVGLRLGSIGLSSVPTDWYATFNLSTGAVNFSGNSAGNTPIAGSLSVGNGWWRVWIGGVSSTTLAANDVAIFPNANGDTTSSTDPSVTAYFYGHQVEDISGQSIQTPGPYVPMLQRAASAAFPAWVDGVGYFAFNQAGTAIPATTLLGYLSEAPATQLVTPAAAIRNMADASWTLGATMTRDATPARTGIDGLTSVCTRLTAGAVAATNTITQTLVDAAVNRTYSCFIKRITGSGPVRLTQNNFTSSADISSRLVTGQWVRVYTTQQAVLNPVFGIGMDTPGDVIDVDFNQFEINTITSPISTVSTRAQDILSYPATNNMSPTVGTLYAEISSPILVGFTNGYAVPIGQDTAGFPELLMDLAGQCYNQDGTSFINSTGGSKLTVGQIKGLACGYDAATLTRSVTEKSGVLASGAFDGSFGVGGNIRIGVSGGSSSVGTMRITRNVLIRNQRLTDAQLDAMVA